MRRVAAGGRDLPRQFGGALLWIDAPPGDAEVTVEYTLPVERKAENSGAFLVVFGHVRNQYFWLPFFDFANPGDQASFGIELRIPKAYRATTSLPQRERVE